MSGPTRAATRPLGEINTTPLIDVLLVLLVMFVITIPPATHALAVDLPQCAQDCSTPPLDPVRNRLTIGSDDSLAWNGTPVDQAQVASFLTASARLPVEPQLELAAEGDASYDTAAKAVAMIRSSGLTRFGFVGNEGFRDFGR